MPYEEGVYSPNLSAVILFTGFVTVKQFYKFFLVKIFLGGFALEGVFHNRIITVLTEPYANRNREAEFVLSGRSFG